MTGTRTCTNTNELFIFLCGIQESSGAYNPQVEAISPSLPNDEARDVIKQSKEELLQSINRADREIGIVEQNLKKLQAKQVKHVVVLILNETDRC